MSWGRAISLGVQETSGNNIDTTNKRGPDSKAIPEWLVASYKSATHLYKEAWLTITGCSLLLSKLLMDMRRTSNSDTRGLALTDISDSGTCMCKNNCHMSIWSYSVVCVSTYVRQMYSFLQIFHDQLPVVHLRKNDKQVPQNQRSKTMPSLSSCCHGICCLTKICFYEKMRIELLTVWASTEFSLLSLLPLSFSLEERVTYQQIRDQD